MNKQAIATDASVLEAIEHLKSTIVDSLGDEVKGFAIRRLDCGEDCSVQIALRSRMRYLYVSLNMADVDFWS